LHVQVEGIKLLLSEKAVGKPAWNKGLSNSVAAENGRKSAEKLSETVRGRRIQVIDGKRKWVYRDESGSFWKENGRKCYLPPV